MSPTSRTVVKMITASRRHWRQALLNELKVSNPAQARWLQEHPRRAEILNLLTTDVIDFWLEAVTERDNPPSEPSVWTSMTQEDVAWTVVARTLEAPDLWPDLDETFPRTPPPPPVDPIPLQLIPPTGPTRPR